MELKTIADVVKAVAAQTWDYPLTTVESGGSDKITLKHQTSTGRDSLYDIPLDQKGLFDVGANKNIELPLLVGRRKQVGSPLLLTDIAEFTLQATHKGTDGQLKYERVNNGATLDFNSNGGSVIRFSATTITNASGTSGGSSSTPSSIPSSTPSSSGASTASSSSTSSSSSTKTASSSSSDVGLLLGIGLVAAVVLLT